MKRIIYFPVVLIVFLISFVFVSKAVFSENTPPPLQCNDRFLNLVNPVRNRQLWVDKSLIPIKDQYQAVVNKGFAATWLLQYDTLVDKELVDFISEFDSSQELGVFLEISEKLGYASGVIYPHGVPWYDPKAVFLSAYSLSERRDLIDTLFSDFKNIFGDYPKAVGAWWIDSYSLGYMSKKYGIEAAMIVADQLTTDHYGVWGQWWGVPYYPSKTNVLKPAVNLQDKQDVVIVQWAQRDLTKAYGESPVYSNYSLQANDYLERGLDTDYFKNLTGVYLDCELPLAQITVGLETGMEGETNKEEYQKQLEYLYQIDNLNSVTMSGFAQIYKDFYPISPKALTLNDSESQWLMTANFRRNDKLGDYVDYSGITAFSDHFIADKNSFLNRRLTDGPLGGEQERNLPLFLLVVVVTAFYAIRKKLFNLWLAATAFLYAAYGLLLNSHKSFGWNVYYGPVIENHETIGFFIAVVVFVSFYMVWKIFINKQPLFLKYFIWLMPLTFGLNTIIRIIRYTNIEGVHYLGVVFDTFKFFALAIKPQELNFVTLNLNHVTAGALIKFDFNKIWDNVLTSLLFYPAAYVLLAAVLSLLMLKLKPGARKLIFAFLLVCFISHLIYTVSADPRAVVSIIN